MTNQEIYDLMARFDAGGLQKLKLSQGDFKIELEKTAPVAAAAPAMVPVPAAPAAAPTAEEAPAVTAPLVGTFPLSRRGTGCRRGRRSASSRP